MQENFKDDGIEICPKVFQIEVQEIAGIGDFYNDVEFLKSVGVYVARRKAVSDVRFNADYVTSRQMMKMVLVSFLKFCLIQRKELLYGIWIKLSKKLGL